MADELLRAQAHVFRHALSLTSSMSLMCAVELRIPEIIHSHGDSISLSDLSSALRLSPSKTSSLRRLMRTLTHLGYFSSKHNDDSFCLTPNSVSLISNSPSSLSSCVQALLHPLATSPLQNLAKWFSSETMTASAAELEYGKSVWAMAAEKPEVQSMLNNAVDGDTRLMMYAVFEKRREAFEGVTSLVDVGGGNGTCASIIASEFPDVECIVFDLPHVVANHAPIGGQVEFVAGNMFDGIPPADAVLFKVLLHFWTDEDCVQILKRCREAIPKNGGKVMIIDIVLNTNEEDSQLIEAQLSWDMLMMASSVGKERGEHEWRKIFTDAGFSDYKITPLGIRSLIEVFP